MALRAATYGFSGKALESKMVEQLEARQPVSSDREPLGLVWIDCPYPVVAAGLKSALDGRARIHLGPLPPQDDVPSSAIFDTGGVEGLSEGIKRIREVNPEISILVFNLHVNLPLARAALRLGARGFVHAGMEPEQIARAVEVAAEGEVVAPRKLLEFLVANEDPADFDALTPRQRNILALVAEGLSIAEVAGRLYLSESTVKQQLRAAYKALGVKDRKEASKFVNGY
jgi:DNA-binding NarL/FixJ family response regulator